MNSRASAVLTGYWLKFVEKCHYL